MEKKQLIRKYKEAGMSLPDISKKIGIPYHSVWLEINREKNRKYQREYQNKHTYRQDWVEKNRDKWNKYMRERKRKQKKE